MAWEFARLKYERRACARMAVACVVAGMLIMWSLMR